MRFRGANPSVPWITPQATRLLEDWLKPGDVGLEWGSGRSTIWFAKRVRSLTSIEHDRDWFLKVKGQLQESGLDNVTYHHAPIEDLDKATADHLYLKLGKELPEASQDFVLVDGQLRDMCVEVALSRLKPGGLLILDNAHWFLPHATFSPNSVGTQGNPPSSLWGELATRLKSWRWIWTSCGVSDTAFFLRPLTLTSAPILYTCHPRDVNSYGEAGKEGE
jgi:hypothetical protein